MFSLAIAATNTFIMTPVSLTIITPQVVLGIQTAATVFSAVMAVDSFAAADFACHPKGRAAPASRTTWVNIWIGSIHRDLTWSMQSRKEQF
jgi:hypothetical protein